MKLLSLYRQVLRAHKLKLSGAMKQLGDSYVKAEFKAMLKVDNQETIGQFITAWENYITEIEKQPTNEVKGKKISSKTRKLMTDDQKENLRRLKGHALSFKE